MIQIRIDSNIDKLFKSLDQLDTSLMMLREPLERLSPILKKVYQGKFRDFERHRNAYGPSYKRWKDEKGLPVGVKTGNLKAVLTTGGPGSIDRVELHSQRDFVYVYGVDADVFWNSHGYPRRFDDWLKKLGDDLIGLSDVEAEMVLGELAAYIRSYLDTLT
jgi:hypothetical protein